MLSFIYPWLALLAPAPLLVWLLAPPYVTAKLALRAPFVQRLTHLTGQQPHPGGGVTRRAIAPLLALVLVWLLTVAALARPQWIEQPLHREQPTRDLLLLVDLSGSMDTRDFTDAAGRKVDRLTAVKQVLDDFLTRRKGDRVGVVVFGDSPFTLVPFTTDLDLSRIMLSEVAVGMAGPRTALGDAIGLGVNLFAKSSAKARTIIALTDGNDTMSSAPPADAARVARDRGIVIHTVAVGDPQAAGEDRLDEAALQEVSATTGGGFYRAMDRESLAQIYDRLDAIETKRIDVLSFRPRRDIYWISLGAALVVALLTQSVLLLVVRRRRPAVVSVGARPSGALP